MNGTAFLAGRADMAAFALTFDDGPDLVPLDRWLNALEEHGARGTFFFTGEWLDRHPGRARSIIARGHELAHHSYHHRRMGEIPGKPLFIEEIHAAEIAFQEATGRASPAFFRFPYLHYRDENLEWLEEIGYIEVEGFDSGDWAGIVTDDIVANVLPALENGVIVVHHCNDIARGTPGALPRILDAADAGGLKPVLVSDMLHAAGRHPGYCAWRLRITVPEGGPDLPEQWRPIDSPDEARRAADESRGWLTAAAAKEAAGSRAGWRRYFAEPIVRADGLVEDRSLFYGRYFADKYWGYVRAAVKDETLHLLDFASREAQTDTLIYLLRWCAQSALKRGCTHMEARHDMRRLETAARQLGWRTEWIREVLPARSAALAPAI